MKKWMVGSALLLVAFGLAGNVSAMCAGGGMSGVRAGHNRNHAQKPKETFKPWALPSAADVVDLDSSKFFSVADKLSLSADQQSKIESLKKDLEATVVTLGKEQSQARNDYMKTNCESSCRAAAQTVATKAQACKQFNSNSKFESGLAGILTREQYLKYKELSA